MDRRGHDRRKRHVRGSFISGAWLPFIGAIFVLYVVFVVRVQFYATSASSAANTIGDGALRSQVRVNSPGRVMEDANPPKEALAPAPAPVQAQTPKPRDEQEPAQIKPSVTPKKPASPDIQVGAINSKPTTEVTTTRPPIVEPTQPIDRPTAAPVAPAEEATTQPPSSTQPPPTEKAVAEPIQNDAESFASRHVAVSGYKAMNDYLAKYQPREDGPLYLFFACSDDKFKPHDWSELCADAKKTVYDVFAKAPRNTKLLTVYAGSEKFWEFKNKFRDDQDLRVKTVPSIMRWHGYRGETSGMMVNEALTEEPFLRYLFKNTDQPDHFLTPAAMVESKTIETVSSYEAYQAKLAAYKAQQRPRAPLYLLFISGRIPTNNRPWCPYCRFSEMTMEYGFKAFAPPRATLLRVEVTPSYKEWKTPNKYNTDQALGPLRSVPGFFTVRQLASQELQMERIFERFDRIAALRDLFTSVAVVKDE